MAELRQRASVLLAVLSALACSLVYLRTSEATGRLSQDLTYDDVSYVLDAARRLDVAFDSGLVPFLRTFVSDPPHSPFSTALAVVGLAVFGYRDWAAYAANALILVGVSLFLLRFFASERRWVAGLFVLTYLTSPIAFRSITDFRPDLALGFVTAAFVLLFLDAAIHARPRRMIAAGVAFGLALLVKPSFVAHTVAMGMGVVGLYLGLLWSRRTRPIAPREVALAFALGLAVAVPYYAANGRSILQYFWSNTRGDEAHLWSFAAGESPLTLLYRYTFDRTYPAFTLVGRHVTLFAIASALGMAYLAARRRWLDLAVPAGLVLAALGSAAVLVVGRHDNEFFSATFHSLLMLAAFVAVSLVVDGLGSRGRAAVTGALAVAAAAAVAASSGSYAWYVPPEVARGASWNDALVDAIRSDSRGRGITETGMRDLDVFVTAAGPVNAIVLEWTARKARLPATFRDLHRTGSESALVDAAAAAEYVVVPNPSTAAIARFLPSAALQRKILEAIRGDRRFERVPVGVGRDVDRYFLFAHAGALDEAGTPVVSFPGGSIESVDGFLDEEGPYPSWKLPRVRWLSRPTARVCAAGVRPGGDLTVSASLRPAVAGVLRVTSSGVPVAAIPLEPSDAFADLAFDTRAAGSQVCLDFVVERAQPAGETRLVLFRRLALRDAGPR